MTATPVLYCSDSDSTANVRSSDSAANVRAVTVAVTSGVGERGWAGWRPRLTFLYVGKGRDLGQPGRLSVPGALPLLLFFLFLTYCFSSLLYLLAFLLHLFFSLFLSSSLLY